MSKNAAATKTCDVPEELAALVHTLRNPLAGVSGAIQVVCGRLPEALAPERHILEQALSRLSELDAMLLQLAHGRGAAGRSGVHAIALPAAQEPTNAKSSRPRGRVPR